MPRLHIFYRPGPLCVLLAAALPGLGVTACGGAGSVSGAPGASAGAAPHVTLPEIELKGDADHDSDTYYGEPDNEHEPRGRPARIDDARRVSALVKRYYAAAGRGDGVAACRLVYLPVVESIQEANGGTSPGAGGTCAAILSRVFKRQHGQLSAESAALTVASVRVDLNVGAVRLGLGSGRPARYTMVHRERGAWKMLNLLDSTRPILVE
jgi:hypothetical protein